MKLSLKTCKSALCSLQTQYCLKKMRDTLPALWFCILAHPLDPKLSSWISLEVLSHWERVWRSDPEIGWFHQTSSPHSHPGVSLSLWGVNTGEWHGQSIKSGYLIFKLGVISFIYHPLINSWSLYEKWALPSSWKQEKENCHLHSLWIFHSFLSVLFSSS